MKYRTSDVLGFPEIPGVSVTERRLFFTPRLPGTRGYILAARSIVVEKSISFMLCSG